MCKVKLLSGSLSQPLASPLTRDAGYARLQRKVKQYDLEKMDVCDLLRNGWKRLPGGGTMYSLIMVAKKNARRLGDLIPFARPAHAVPRTILQLEFDAYMGVIYSL